MRFSVLRHALIIAVAFAFGSATVAYAGPTISGFVGLIDGANAAHIDNSGQLAVNDMGANALLSRMHFDGGGSLQVTSSGSGVVTISGTPAVTIANTPTVALSSGTTVGISGTPTVSIAGTPAVSISGTPAVTISGNATTRRSAATVLAADKTAGLITAFDSGDLDVGGYTELAFDMLAGNSRLVGSLCCGPCVGTLDVTVDRRAANGTYFQIDHFILADFASASRSYGVGATSNVSFGSMLKLHVTPTAAGSGCGANYSISIIGK